MSKTHLLVMVTLYFAAWGCKQQPPTAGVGAAAGPGVARLQVVWGPESRCADESVNAFVSRAVQHCEARNYEEYRLLWRYDQRPTSRKRFNRLWDAVEQVEIKLVKRIVLHGEQSPDAEDPPPAYVFHAFIRVTPEAVEQSEGKIADRDMVLLIIREQDKWVFVPAPGYVKTRILARGAATQPTSQPVEPQPATNPQEE